jgi:hypothetical protein
MAIPKLFSLAPGFSRVLNAPRRASRFNGLPKWKKPLKRFWHSLAATTGLKPGVNEKMWRGKIKLKTKSIPAR